MIKAAFIGAGSIGFTRQLARDILSVPELQDAHISLTDINQRNLDMIFQLLKKDVSENKLPAKISATLNRRKALEGADYVINVVRIGGLDAFKLDVEIPLKYGIDQCVGDTLCAGGIMYGQRSIPAILDFCKDIREVAGEDALLLNYANPNAMNTWAAIQYGKVKTVGLCHGVIHGGQQIAEVLGAKNPNEVYYICAGINHLTWYTEIIYKNKKVTSKQLLDAFERHPVYSKTEKVRIDVLRRFGYYSTESNGHLSEYVPWYRKRPQDIRRWIDLSTWINGETGGYLRHCSEQRNWFKTDFPKFLKQDMPPIGASSRGPEHLSYIIESLQTGKIYRGHFNVQNKGIIPNLPNDCIVEVPGFVDKHGFNMLVLAPLPPACAATCQACINVQRMAVEAAVHGDLTLLKQAVLHDPLTGAVCDPEEIWQMVDEMVVAQAQWLPQYKNHIAAARNRLAASKPLGTKKWKGAARLKIKSVNQLRKESARTQTAFDAVDSSKNKC